MRPIRSAWNWIKVCTFRTRPPSTCAYRCFPGPNFASTKPPSKCTRRLDLHGNIPTFISITDGKVHDVNILDEILPEAGRFTSWTAATSTSSVSTSSRSVRRFSSYAQILQILSVTLFGKRPFYGHCSHRIGRAHV